MLCKPFHDICTFEMHPLAPSKVNEIISIKFKEVICNDKNNIARIKINIH